MKITRYASKMLIENLTYGTPMINGKYSLRLDLFGVFSDALDNSISEAELLLAVDEPHTLHLTAAKGRKVTLTVEVEHGD